MDIDILSVDHVKYSSLTIVFRITFLLANSAYEHLKIIPSSHTS